MRNFLVVVTCAVVGGCSPATQPTIAVAPRSVVYTSGVGVLHVPANLATVTIDFTARGKTSRDAGDSTAARINEIRAALEAIGISPNEMPSEQQTRWWSRSGNQARMEIKPYQPDTVHLRPRYDSIWVRPERTMDTTYIVTQQFTAQIRNLDLVGPAIDAALDAGAQTISNLSFSRTETRGPYTEALEMASQYARDNAESMVEKQGARLGRLLELSTMPLGTAPPRGIQLEGIVVTGSASGRTATTIVAPEIKITATVYARWEVIQ